MSKRTTCELLLINRELFHFLDINFHLSLLPKSLELLVNYLVWFNFLPFDSYLKQANDTLEYFQQALATWKNNPGIGLFIHAVKSGQKPSLTKPGCGWREWADEAIKRRLMQYSQSHNGDITVHFVRGGQALWSQLRSLSWSEVERVASGGQTV